MGQNPGPGRAPVAAVYTRRTLLLHILTAPLTFGSDHLAGWWTPACTSVYIHVFGGMCVRALKAAGIAGACVVGFLAVMITIGLTVSVQDDRPATAAAVERLVEAAERMPDNPAAAERAAAAELRAMSADERMQDVMMEHDEILHELERWDEGTAGVMASGDVSSVEAERERG